MCGPLSDSANQTVAALASSVSNPPNDGDGEVFELHSSSDWKAAVCMHCICSPAKIVRCINVSVFSAAPAKCIF